MNKINNIGEQKRSNLELGVGYVLFFVSFLPITFSILGQGSVLADGGGPIIFTIGSIVSLMLMLISYSILKEVSKIMFVIAKIGWASVLFYFVTQTSM